MKNVISQQVAGLIGQAQIAYPAVVLHGTGLGLLIKVDEATVRLTNLIVSSATLVDEKHELKLKRQSKADLIESARQFTTLTRHTLTPFIGKKLSSLWATVGFDGSFAIPRSGVALLALLAAIKKYLLENPTHENAGSNVTAARAGVLITDLTAILTAVNEQKGVVRGALMDRDTKAKPVRSDMQVLLKDLKGKADPMGEVWAKFGFNRPGASEIPEVPTNLIVVLTGPTSAALKWDHAERAERYRIYKKVVGVDEDFVLVETRDDLDFILEGLAANATTQIAVAAVNNGGESAMSEVVTVVTV